MGKWFGSDDDEEGHGDWFEGTVNTVDKINQTIHILYDDGDEDTELAWINVSIID